MCRWQFWLYMFVLAEAFLYVMSYVFDGYKGHRAVANSWAFVNMLIVVVVIAGFVMYLIVELGKYFWGMC